MRRRSVLPILVSHAIAIAALSAAVAGLWYTIDDTWAEIIGMQQIGQIPFLTAFGTVVFSGLWTGLIFGIKGGD